MPRNPRPGPRLYDPAFYGLGGDLRSPDSGPSWTVDQGKEHGVRFRFAHADIGTDLHLSDRDAYDIGRAMMRWSTYDPVDSPDRAVVDPVPLAGEAGSKLERRSSNESARIWTIDYLNEAERDAAIRGLADLEACKRHIDELELALEGTRQQVLTYEGLIDGLVAGCDPPVTVRVVPKPLEERMASLGRHRAWETLTREALIKVLGWLRAGIGDVAISGKLKAGLGWADAIVARDSEDLHRAQAQWEKHLEEERGDG